MATAKKTARKAPDLSKVKHTKAKTGVTWENKRVAAFQVTDGHEWEAQLSKCSDGRKFRSIKQVIRKRDGTVHYINGMSFKNEPTGNEIKGMIRLLLKVMPKTAVLTGLAKEVTRAAKNDFAQDE